MKAVVFAGWKHELNLTAIIRTADGLGFDEVVFAGRKKLDFDLMKYCMPRKSLREIDGHKPKIIQLSNTSKILSYLESRKYRPVCMEIDKRATLLEKFSWPSNPAIIVGHEREGVPEDILAVAEKVRLNMQGKVKCMNVACAAAIAMYDHFLKSTFPILEYPLVTFNAETAGVAGFPVV